MDPELLPAPHAATLFGVADGELQLGGLPLRRLAERVGQTPFYAYDRTLLRQRVRQLRAQLPPEVRLHYALKANPLPALACLMAGLVDGMDVASAGELRTALDTGMPEQSISFAGPGKRASELRQAVASGVLVHVESAREVRLLEDLSAELGLAARVAVRVNPDFELRGSGMKMGGGAKPFGVDVAQVPQLLARIGHSGLRFEGFHLFAGSQNLRADAICEAQQKSYALALRLAQHAPQPPRLLNLGGGLGIPYFPGEQRLNLAPIADNLARLQQRAAQELPGAELVMELGRYLVGEAGVYVARVLERKQSCGQVFVVCDGGLHQHLAACGLFGQVLRRNYPVAIGNRMQAAAQELASVVVFQSGAYGASASPQAFLGHPPCPEVLV